METDGDDFLSHSVRALFRWKGQRKLRWKSSQVQWNDWRLFSVCVFIFFFLLLGNSFDFWNLDDVAVLAVGWPTSSFCLTISWYNDMWSRNDEKLSRRLFPMYLSYTHQSKRVRESFAYRDYLIALNRFLSCFRWRPAVGKRRPNWTKFFASRNLSVLHLESERTDVIRLFCFFSLKEENTRALS